MKPKFIDYDVVKALKKLDSAVSTGTTGTVLMVFTTTPPSYEVEFVDDAGESLAVLTTGESDLEFIQHGG